MNEKTEQIKAVMADEAFVKACIEAENEEAVQKLLADKGIEMSLTEIELMKEMTGAVADGSVTVEQLEKLSNAGELSEEELAEAAGGGPFDFLYDKIACPLPHNSEEYVGNLTRLSVSKTAGFVAAAAITVAGIGYGIYDAVRRRW